MSKNQQKKAALDQVEQMRQTVIEQELSSRSWKAYYEKMYYTIESEKIEEEYKACQERLQAKAKAEREAMEIFLKQMSEKKVPHPEEETTAGVPTEDEGAE